MVLATHGKNINTQKEGKIAMNRTYQWKVSCENLNVKSAHQPFFKLFSIVYASSRTQAIKVFKYMFYEPSYGNFRAKKLGAQSLNALTI